jgi:hypothetical protein
MPHRLLHLCVVGASGRPRATTVARWQQRARAGLLCLLACVVPLQCGAALVRASAGPSHLHRAAPAAPAPVLHDFRRQPVLAVVAPAPARVASTSSSGHDHAHPHAHADARRHRHTPGVLAVISSAMAIEISTEIDTDVDRRDAADESSGNSTGAASAFLPIPAHASPWRAPAAVHGWFDAALWVASLRVDAPAERPPRPDTA